MFLDIKKVLIDDHNYSTVQPVMTPIDNSIVITIEGIDSYYVDLEKLYLSWAIKPTNSTYMSTFTKISSGCTNPLIYKVVLSIETI